MAITFDEIVRDEGCPGFEPARHISGPWSAEPLKHFEAQDVERFWFMGFQWPRAQPLNYVWLEDGFAWATQWAAQAMPLPSGDGLAPRIAGIHVYGSDVPVSEWIGTQRSGRVAASLPSFLRDFPEIWITRKAEILSGLKHLERYSFDGKSDAELAQYLEDARNFHRRAWEIHFELM